MKTDDFLSEVMQSPLCPENFQETYNYFRKYQDMALETLKEFHRICEKNGINYCVTYGSLIGIVRDGGQIPWDYDIDTFVPITQRDDLIKSIKSELSDKFYAMCPETDPSCRHYILRMCPVGYDSAAVHIDVFFYCGAPNDVKDIAKFCRSLRLCAQMRFARLVRVREESLGNPLRYIKLLLGKIGSLFYSLKYVDKKHDKLISKYPIDESRLVVEAAFYATHYEIPTEMLTKTMLYTSDIGEYRIPQDYDGLLTLIYGDYKSRPSLQSRINQVLRSTSRFRYFESLNK